MFEGELVYLAALHFSVMTIIVLNVFTMALEYYKIEENEAEYKLYQGAMKAFTYFYYFEFALKFFAMGCHYFLDSWCSRGIQFGSRGAKGKGKAHASGFR